MIYLIIGLVLCSLMETQLFDDKDWGVMDRFTLIMCWPLLVIGVIVVFLK
jgi:hypothetical protein|tara:strand:- start:12 stop:161 length:150 start_codon:yes stop_codon:yes gene_type:complete